MSLFENTTTQPTLYNAALRNGLPKLFMVFGLKIFMVFQQI